MVPPLPRWDVAEERRGQANAPGRKTAKPDSVAAAASELADRLLLDLVPADPELQHSNFDLLSKTCPCFVKSRSRSVLVIDAAWNRVFRCFCRQNRLLLPGTKLATLLSPAPPHVRPSRRESPHPRLHLLNGRTVGQRNAGRRRPRRAATEDLIALRERCYRCDVGCEGDNCHPRREANLGLPFRRRELCRAGGDRGAAARRVSSGGLQQRF